MGESNMLDRRSFIRKGAAAGGIVALSGLVGCSGGGDASTGDLSNAPWLPERWDFEADIVAVGAGGAGLAAGIEARDLDLDIIVLESQVVVGGDSAICNGGICCPGSALQAAQGIEDSADLMYEDLLEYTAPDNDPQYLRILADEQAKLYDWLVGLGVTFREESLIGTTGQSVPREHHVNPGDTISILNEAAKDRGVDIQLDTLGVRLVQDPITKRILGVEAQQGNETLYYKAKKGVILSTGGYARNVELLNQFNFGEGAEDFQSNVYDSLGCTGGGHIMAMKVGAKTRHMSYISMLTVQNPDGKKGDACAMYHVGAVLVNIEGNRFVNEAQGYIDVWSELNQEPERTCFQVWDQTIADDYSENDSSYYSFSKVQETGLLLQADTYDELALLMGVPVETFVATMDKYNSDVSTLQRDTVFDREHLVSTVDVPAVLNHPPYYAFKTVNVLCDTKGGIQMDEKAQAVDLDGNGIPSLFLAGNISGYAHQGIYPGTRKSKNGSGVGFGGALAFGRFCANQIAQLDNWDKA